MRFSLVLTLLASSLVCAFPAKTPAVVDESDFPAGLKGLGLLDITTNPRITKEVEGMVRGPCPFLNTAANHGFLPYTGRGIKAPWIRRLIIKAGLPDSFAGTLADAVTKLAVKKNQLDSNHPADAIDLIDLNVPRDSEHDVSFTRHDMKDGEVPAINRPDPKLVEGMIKTANDMSTNKDATVYLTFASLAAWRKKRYAEESKTHKPAFGIFNPKALLLAAGEEGFILHVLGQNGNMDEHTARSILARETFPEGWKAHPVSLWSMVSAIGRGVTGSYLPEFALNWFHKWSTPTESAATGDNASTEKSAWGKYVMGYYRWAFGATDTKPTE